MGTYNSTLFAHQRGTGYVNLAAPLPLHAAVLIGTVTKQSIDASSNIVPGLEVQIRHEPRCFASDFHIPCKQNLTRRLHLW